MLIALSLPEFIARWEKATLSERSAAQSHFLDLCQVLGQPAPTAADQAGTFYTFEKGVAETDSGDRDGFGEAARGLVEKRDRWLDPPGASEVDLKKRTLTNLYNERPTWLDLAHRRLDEAVLDAYGWPRDLSDEQILERLLALNLERAAVREKEDLQ